METERLREKIKDTAESLVVLQLKECNFHPIFCRYLKGYFATVAKMVVKGPVSVQETKCSFTEDGYHEYLIKW